MFELRRLRLLRELELRGTIAAVAQALNYSPSTVSQQLSILEKEVGVELLESVGRRVRLTPQAHILVTHTHLILNQMERAEAEIARSVRELTGTLRIAAFQSVCLTILPGALTDLEREHPGLRVEVFQDEPETSLPQLLAHDYDLVVAEEYPHRPLSRSTDLDWDELCVDRLRIAVPPGFIVSAEPSENLALLARHRWISEPEGKPSRAWLVDMCRGLGFEPDIHFFSYDLLVLCRFVQAGHAVAVLPDLLRSAVSDYPQVIDFPGTVAARRIVTACRRGAATHPAIAAGRGALAAQLRTP